MSSELLTEDIIINDLKIKLATDNKNFKIMIWFDDYIKHKLIMPYDVTNNEMKRIVGLLK